MVDAAEAPVVGIAEPALARWANPNDIPAIDFSPLTGKSPDAVDRLAREVHDAARDIGFFTVVNHPVPPALVRDVFPESKRFFALPLEARMKLEAENPPRFETMKLGEAMLYLYSRVWPSKAAPEQVGAY